MTNRALLILIIFVYIGASIDFLPEWGRWGSPLLAAIFFGILLLFPARNASQTTCYRMEPLPSENDPAQKSLSDRCRKLTDRLNEQRHLMASGRLEDGVNRKIIQDLRNEYEELRKIARSIGIGQVADKQLAEVGRLLEEQKKSS